MYRIRSANGTTVSFDKQGTGPALVLVHGAFSDHRSNWELVLPRLSKQFTVYAVARRGRGETDVTEGHSIASESEDIAAVMNAIGEPAFLLGHSYGAHVALGAALMGPEAVRKLILYEAPWPHIIGDSVLLALGNCARAGDWDGFSFWFFQNVLEVPGDELHTLRASELWKPIVNDARASLGDLLAVASYNFNPGRFAGLNIPVLLQIGTESPRHLYVTDVLASMLPDARIGSLPGQAHEGMTTSPQAYVDTILAFLTDTTPAAHP